MERWNADKTMTKVFQTFQRCSKGFLMVIILGINMLYTFLERWNVFHKNALAKMKIEKNMVFRSKKTETHWKVVDRDQEKVVAAELESGGILDGKSVVNKKELSYKLSDFMEAIFTGRLVYVMGG